jgi:hypothetical protein
VTCLHVASTLECLIVSHLLILCSHYYMCRQFLCLPAIFCFVFKQQTWLILSNFLLLLPFILLRHAAVLHCDFFGVLMYLCLAFYCVSDILLCVSHSMLCQPFYASSIIYKLCANHFLVCKPFYNVAAIFMLWHPF